MPETVEPVVAYGLMAGAEQPTLDAGELTLRPWRLEDTEVLTRAYGDHQIRRWHGRSMSGAEAAGWIAERAGRWRREQGADWAIAHVTDVVGRIGLRRIEHDQGIGEVVYWVLPEARGRGVAQQSLKALTAWALDRLGLHRLELEHAVANVASCRVAVAGGFRYEGTKRAAVLHADGWQDMHLHALLSGDERAPSRG